MAENWDSLLDGVPEPSHGIRLTRDELLVIDWVICSGSQLLGATLDDLITQWEKVRLSVWSAVADCGPKSPNGQMFTIDEWTAKALLAATPTTLIWGESGDCGFSLKMKLSQYLLGTYVDPETIKLEEPTDAIDSTEQAKDDSESDAATVTFPDA